MEQRGGRGPHDPTLGAAIRRMREQGLVRRPPAPCPPPKARPPLSPIRGGGALPTPKRRWIAFGLAGIVLLLIAAAATLFFVPLPISVVEPRIVAAIQERLGPGYNVSIGKAAIDRGEDGIELRLDRFEVLDPGGVSVLRVPSASVALDGDLALGRTVGARRIRLVEPHLTLRIEADGDVALAGSEGGPPLFRLPGGAVPAGAPPEISGLVATADAVLRSDGPLASLSSAEVLRAQFVIDDRRRNRVERIEGMDLRIARRLDGEGLLASASAAGAQERWSMSATLDGRPGDGRTIDLGFENLSIPRLIGEATADAAPTNIQGTVSGQFLVELTPDGDIPGAEATIELAGLKAASLREPDATVALDRARFVLRWNAAERRVSIEPSTITAGSNGRAVLTGEARPADAAGDKWAFSLRGREIAIAGPTEASSVLRLDGIELSGRLDRETRVVRLDRAAATSPAISVLADAVLDFGAPVPRFEFNLEAGEAPIDAVLRLWPKPIAAQAHQWLEEHVPQAFTRRVKLVHSGPFSGPDEGRPLTLDIDYHGATLDVLEGAPPLREASGTVQVRDEAMRVNIERGRAEMAPGQVLAFTNGVFSSPNVRPDPFEGDLSLRIAGPIAGVGKLLKAPELRPFAPPGLDLTAAGGAISGALRLRGLYGRGARLADLLVTLDAETRGGELDRALGERKLEAADLKLLIDETSGAIRGDAKLAGAPVAFEARAPRNERGGFGETTVVFTIDPSKMRGGMGDLKISGPVATRIVFPDPAQVAGAQVEADLTGASVSGAPGVSKTASQSGRAQFRVEGGDGRWSLQNFSAEAGALALKGSIDLDRNGTLSAARFAQFKLNPGDDARLDLDRAGPGHYRVALKGGAFDMRPLLKETSSKSGPPAKGKSLDIDVEAKLGTAVGLNGEAIAGLDLKLSKRGETLRALQMTGRLGQGRIEAISSEQGQRQLSVRGGDAGATLRFFDVYRRLRGGQLSLDLTFGNPNRGILTVRDFSVADENAIASVVASQPGGESQQAVAQRGVRFTKMQGNFRHSDGKIRVDEAAIWGPEVGATLEGDIDYAADRIDIRGTFVPAYAVNNLFGQVPLLGTILGGGSREGLLGITFALSGPMNNPATRINPMSAVAPGFLRKIFEFRNSEPNAFAPTGRVGTPGQ